jgi:UDP-N-acetylmuramoylalanine--D-glutamate ligase
MQLARERVAHLVLFGEAAEKIEKAAQALGLRENGSRITRVNGLQDAILKAAELAASGDVVLLSPGGTSFDEFNDFAERGERFKEWVRELS